VFRGQRGEKTESGEFQQFLVTELTRMEQNIMDFATQHEVFCSGNVFSHWDGAEHHGLIHTTRGILLR
jgi:hypothetical protein